MQQYLVLCMRIYVVGIPLQKSKTIASTYATYTVTLLDNYKQQFEQLYTL